MNKSDFESRISEFYKNVKEYKELLFRSLDNGANLVRNVNKINEERSNLNIMYGKLSKYIKKLGNYPYLSDIGGGPYPAYEVGLSADIIQRRGPCLEAIMQDLEYILGKLDEMSKEEFSRIFFTRVGIESSLEMTDKIEKSVKRGRESWNLFGYVFGVLLTILGTIIGMLPLSWTYKTAFWIVIILVLLEICFINGKTQNWLIGVKIKYENIWKKV